MQQILLSSSFYLICLLFWSRVLGGLLNAYDLCGEKVFLEKAKDLADKLLPAWNTPSGIPYNRINLAYGNTNNPTWARVCFVFTMYFIYLSNIIVLTKISYGLYQNDYFNICLT